MTASAPGGRRSHRQRTGDAESPSTRGGWRVVPIVVLLVAAALIGWSTTRDAEPAVAPPGSTELPLTRTELTCPGIGAADLPAAKAGIGFTSLPSDGGGDGDGESTVEFLSLSESESIATPNAPAAGAWQVVRQVVRQGSDESEPVLVSASGAMAAGATAYTATTATDRAGAGLAIGECARASREAWFVGAGSTVDHTSTLLISNPSPTDAVVDVSLLTADGSLEPVSTSGMVIGPREVVRLSLSEFAASEGDTAVHVRASQGQVAAAVLDSWTSTLEPAGTEWIPSAQPPASSLTVGPLVADADRGELIVGNPGDRSASVDIQVVGPDGTSPVQEFESLTVGAGAVEVLAVPALLNDRTASLRLDSDQPVVASVRSMSDGSPVDIAYGTSLPDVAGPAVVPLDLPTVDPSGLSLVVSGADPGAEAAFAIEARDADGSSLANASLTAAPGSVAIVEAGRRGDLDVDLADAAYLVVTPTAGPLRVSAIYASDDSSWSSVPLQSAPTVVRAPGVYPLP